MLGIDLIDLTAARALSKAADLRFRERAFGPDENQYIDAAEDPELTLWSLWAAKESFYKAMQQRAPWKRGTWRSIRVLAPPAGVRFTYQHQAELICCVCSDHLRFTTRTVNAAPTDKIRLATAELAALGLQQVHIRREELAGRLIGPPRIYEGTALRAEWELSFADDGPWIAYAFAPPHNDR